MNEIANKNILEYILNLEAESTLFIVSCTKEKIWDFISNAPEYIDAKNVYKGEEFLTFLNWYNDNNLRELGFLWIILSGKYGFIEPEHPISWYDINLAIPKQYPLSLFSLQNQVNQLRRWKYNSAINEIRLNNFQNIICVNCDDFYIENIKKSFGKKNYIIINDIHQIY